MGTWVCKPGSSDSVARKPNMGIPMVFKALRMMRWATQNREVPKSCAHWALMKPQEPERNKQDIWDGSPRCVVQESGPRVRGGCRSNEQSTVIFLLVIIPWVAQMVKNLPAMWEIWVWSLGWKIPWRRKWQPTPVFLPGKSDGWRSLAGYSLWGRKESDMTEQLTLTQ